MFLNSLLFSPLRFVFNLFCLNGIEGSEDQIIGLWHSSQALLQAHPPPHQLLRFFFFQQEEQNINDRLYAKTKNPSELQLYLR